MRQEDRSKGQVPGFWPGATGEQCCHSEMGVMSGSGTRLRQGGVASSLCDGCLKLEMPLCPAGDVKGAGGCMSLESRREVRLRYKF